MDKDKLTKDDLHSLTETLGSVVGQDENFDISEVLIRLLTLEDDEFEILAPGVMQAYQQAINNPNDKLLLVQSLNANGASTEDLIVFFDDFQKQIDNIPLSVVKRNFLTELVASTINSINETEGIAKRTINVPIELCHPDAKIPQYSTVDDAGADVYAIEDTTIKPGEIKIIPLGIKLAVPPGYAVLVHPRSGLSARTKMRVANSIGLCDAGYRDEYKIIIENIEPPVKDIDYTFNEDGSIHINSILHGSSIHITKGERIAQLRLVEVPKISFYRVDSVKEIGENRGGGIGHTGI